MVDEYQDTSFCTISINLHVVLFKSKNICVVGDDDQSIYSWRGARSSIISDFLRQFPSAKKLR